MTERDAILRLVRLDLERTLPLVRRAAVGLAIFAGILALGGWLTGPRFWLLAGVVIMTAVMNGPMGVVRDKLDGGLEFLVSLPIPASTIAVSRLLYAFLVGVPCGIGLTLAVWPGDPDTLAAMPGSPLSVYTGFVLLTVLGSMLAIGCALRFEGRHVINVVMGVFVGAVVIGEVGPRVLPDRFDVASLLAGSWVLPVAWIACAGIPILLVLLSYHLARTGIERFTPGRDRITW